MCSDMETREIWLPIVGYEGLYEVSDFGRIRSVDREISYKSTGIAIRRGKLLRGVTDKKGYIHLVLCKNGKQKTFFVSRLVAAAFKENPLSLPDVHHRDFDKSNNAASNLEWTSHRENIAHSVKEHRYRKRLTPEIVTKIRERARNGESQAAIARSLSIRYQTVHLIVNGHYWRHID